MQGIGVVWYRLALVGTELPIGALSGDLRQLGFGQDSSQQNNTEFIASTCLELWRLGILVRVLFFEEIALAPCAGASTSGFTGVSSRMLRCCSPCC